MEERFHRWSAIRNRTWHERLSRCSSRLIPEPPERLYVIGDPSALKEGLVVGARKATPYGLNATKCWQAVRLNRRCGDFGRARGCDASRTMGACGWWANRRVSRRRVADEPYPKSNVDLFRRIVKGGGVVASEFPWHYPPKPFMFRKRNRLDCGLARDAYRGSGASQRYILYDRRYLCLNKDVPGARVDFFRHIGGLEYVACAGGYAHRE